MIKKGVILSTGTVKNKKLYTVKIDNSEIKNYCSIKSSECGLKNKCPGGCTGCAGDSETGLFANNTDIITASHCTNQEFDIGASVLVETKTKSVILQAVFTVFLPFIIGLICSVTAYIFLKTETAIIAGFFAGISFGVCAAMLCMPLRNNTYPKIIGKNEIES